MHRILPAFIFIAFSLTAFAQGTFIPLGSDAYTYLDRFDIKYGKLIPLNHTGDKPYYRSKAAKIAESLLLSNLVFDKVQQSQLQYLVDEDAEWLDSMHSVTRHPLWKLYREPASLAHVDSKPKGLFDLRINPMVELHVGGETMNSRFIFTRSVGVEVRGNIKRVFSFYFNATGNSARLPQYITDKTNQGKYVFVPGTGYFKVYGSSIFKFSDGVDYFDARGYVNVNVLKYINITFGRDKNFIGNGVRSLFLSDYSAPYLFLKFNLDISRFHYQSIFAELTSQYIRGYDQLLPKKYMAVHHLSIEATHWLNLGLFEAVVFNRSNNFELQYLNPLIFYRAVEHALGSPDNELIGADFKVNIARHVSVYGQVLLDEFNFGNFFKHNGWWANKWGLQLGVKYIDILPNLDGQIEFNMVRPYTYTHDSTTNYSNYNQPLAHPLGANFFELLFNFRYQPSRKLTFNLKYVVASMGDDTSTVNSVLNNNPNEPYANFGGDILKPSNSIANGPDDAAWKFGNGLGQGAPGLLNMVQFTATYKVWHNVYVDAEMTYRSRTSYKTVNNATPTGNSFIFMIGGRWNIPYKSNLF